MLRVGLGKSRRANARFFGDCLRLGPPNRGREQSLNPVMPFLLRQSVPASPLQLSLANTLPTHEKFHSSATTGFLDSVMTRALACTAHRARVFTFALHSGDEVMFGNENSRSKSNSACVLPRRKPGTKCWASPQLTVHTSSRLYPQTILVLGRDCSETDEPRGALFIARRFHMDFWGLSRS